MDAEMDTSIEDTGTSQSQRSKDVEMEKEEFRRECEEYISSNANNGAESNGNKTTLENEAYTTTVSQQEIESPGSVRDCVIKMLDEMDERVDKLRSDAMAVETERDDILSSLDTLCNAQMVSDLGGIDLDEVTRYIERLARRSMAIHVGINHERSLPQLESLHKVNNMIDSLIRDLKNDAMNTRKRCIAYINACSEEINSNFKEIDAMFETAVLGCSVEDQKRVKKRLTGLYSYFSSTTTTTFCDMDDVDVEVSETVERSLEQR